MVPVRFSNEGPVKHRPAVVLSVDAFQLSRAEVIVAALTSNLRRPPLLGDHFVGDWQGAGLPKPSRATSILRTLRHDLIVGQLGTMSVSDLAEIDRSVASVLGLRAATRT